MDRREFVQSLSACAALSALPSVLAQQVGIGALGSFVDALKTKPWLLGFAGTSEAELFADDSGLRESAKPIGWTPISQWSCLSLAW